MSEPVSEPMTEPTSAPTTTSPTTVAQRLAELRWDDHRYYHQSRINQTLHLISACAFLVAYGVLFFDPASAALIALGPEPQPQQISFPGMPAARRLGLDADACTSALTESREEIEALRQALNV